MISIPRIAILIAALLSTSSPARADDMPSSDALFARLDTNHDGQLAADEIADEHQRLFARLVRSGDTNDDGQLTTKEFTEALTPSRPEKPIEKPQDADFPGAKATKWLLLTLDTNGDSRLVADEIPEEYQRVFERLADQIDRDEDGILNRGEINRGGPQLARQAVQAAERMEINVERELAKIAKEQGDRANRFDEAPDMRQALSDPSNARELFTRLDENSDGYVTLEELPDPLRERLARPFRRVDADRDKRLSPEEFATLARRLGAVAGFMERRPAPKP